MDGIELDLTEVQGAAARLRRVNGECRDEAWARSVFHAQSVTKWGSERGPADFGAAFELAFRRMGAELVRLSGDADEVAERTEDAALRLAEVTDDEASQYDGELAAALFEAIRRLKELGGR